VSLLRVEVCGFELEQAFVCLRESVTLFVLLVLLTTITIKSISCIIFHKIYILKSIISIKTLKS
jgi:hypothetical protein